MLCCGVIGIFFDTTIRKDGFFLPKGTVACLCGEQTGKRGGGKEQFFETAWEGKRQICFKVGKIKWGDRAKTRILSANIK